MLGVLCARPKAWLLATLSLSYAHGFSAAHIQGRLVQSPTTTTVLRSVVVNGAVDQRRHHSSNCLLGSDDSAASRGGAASIWHAILPAGGERRLQGRTTVIHHHDFELMRKGEGSWNAAWDARPARWLHNPDSAWLLFGVCACLAAPPPLMQAIDLSEAAVSIDAKGRGTSSDNIHLYSLDHSSATYKVKGVPADGRCLFRAIAHVACLRNGEEDPDENRQRELADDLRAQVVDELLRRRKEAEWFIEGDFDEYVKRIQRPYVWGGEPELLMASHVLKTPISVFMINRSSGGLSKIANYGEEYRKDEENPINVLFHGYGHYDILEAVSDQSYLKVEA